MRPTRTSLLYLLFPLLLTNHIHGFENLAALSRRTWWQRLSQGAAASVLVGSSASASASASPVVAAAPTKDSNSQPFQYSQDWTGTTLVRMELQHAVEKGTIIATTTNLVVWPMGRWPDPVLRIPADPVQEHWFGTPTLQQACNVLINTSIQNEAAGLAAQQCGVNARIVALKKQSVLSSDKKKKKQLDTNDFQVMINPQIIARSAETKMKVWNEHCLMLPPTFVATVLRDAVVDVQYRTVDGQRRVVRWTNEPARAMQHELDHDRGILVTDHVGLSELENNVMRAVEQPGHEERMQLAFDRSVYVPWEEATV